MKKQWSGLCVAIALSAVTAAAQTNTFPTSGNVGIGTTTPSEQLDIKGSGSSELSIQNNWLSGTGVWINMSTDGPSGIGSGGPGGNAWIGYVASDGQWFANAAPGDIAYRNGGGRLLFGNSGNSPAMAISNGNVGIGMMSPYAILDFGYTGGKETIDIFNGGTANRQGMGTQLAEFQTFIPTNNHFSWNSGGDLQASGTNELMRLTGNGYLGIGTTWPGYKLDVEGGQINSSGGYCIGGSCITSWPTAASNTWSGTQTFSGNMAVNGVLTGYGGLASTMSSPTGGSLSLINPSKTASATAYNWALYNMTGSYGNSLQFWDYNEILCGQPGAICGPRLTLTDSGDVGIGTTTPGAVPPSGYVAGTPILEVQGDVVLTNGSGGSITFQDGTTQTTAFVPANCGADYAESVGVSGDRTKYGPGDVMVIDPSAPGQFLRSNQPYSTLVAGVYSTQPGFVGRKHPEDAASRAAEVPMAMVGRVPTKVSAENGPIQVGDLLVSSSTLGYAMKGTDRSQMLGAVIGKALGSLDAGTGVIEVLVTLQ